MDGAVPWNASQRSAQGVHGGTQRRDVDTAALAVKARADAAERASFDPFFTFFLGGVVVVDGLTSASALIGVSGLPG